MSSACRKQLGKQHGVATVSRDVLAKLLDVSSGSVSNWENGTASITARLATKLSDLQARVNKGEVKIELPKRGGRPKKAAGARAGRAAAAPRKRRGRPRTVKIEGEAPSILYANYAHVTANGQDALVRFALIVPGDNGARAVCDVLVPRAVLASMR